MSLVETRAVGRSGARRLSVRVQGAVQGVGFRPFVYREAVSLGLDGSVLNSINGVEIELEGPRADLESFLSRLEGNPPPLARIRRIDADWSAPRGMQGFHLAPSSGLGASGTVEVLPDVATCPDCLADILDPSNRRYRYPFTNCTNCGPRFSIIESLPYDRAATTMRHFPMCDACRDEYGNPLDRRFHAQPNACPACGPQLDLREPGGRVVALRDRALCETARRLRDGAIVAVKGLGGFHLMVSAGAAAGVRELRRRKHREAKPFAVMFPGCRELEQACRLNEAEKQLVTSWAAPIVLVRRRGRDPQLCEELAPGSPFLGAFLPYTPLHHLLLAEVGIPLVATSGNLSDEPICIDEDEALDRLGNIADCFLVHNRPIARPVDDSVFRVVMDRPLPLRLARGYAPLSLNRPGPAGVPDSEEAPCAALAVGAHEKNTIALTRPGGVVLSQHQGDLVSLQADANFQRTVETLKGLYRVRPGRVACDLHPDYRSTRYAESRFAAPVRVQHHVAHVLSCAADNDVGPPWLGVAWDGTGLGTDDTIWGGEFIGWDAQGLLRRAHLRTFRLPGGEKAVREPRRAALGLLWEILGEALWSRHALAPVADTPERERVLLRQALQQGLHAPVTSSAGRLFDAVASIAGLRQRVSFEGQAAMELEYALEDPQREGAYPFTIRTGQDPLVVDWEPAIRALLADLQAGRKPACVSARFHNGLANAIVQVADRLGYETVLLTGGCFQNAWLTERTVHRLRETGHRPLWHLRVPPNDGGIALGQMMALEQEGR